PLRADPEGLQMNASLLAKLAGATLSGVVALSLVAGLDALAVQQHAATAIAQGRTTPALMAVATPHRAAHATTVADIGCPVQAGAIHL
ncbi:MAG: hypothetical protein ABI696_14250, partial [Rubrivivax sp.]